MNQQIINNNLIKQNYNSDFGYNQIRASPIFDANFGLPTPSMAEMAFNKTKQQTRKLSQIENCSTTKTLKQCFNSSINNNTTLTSKSNLITTNENNSLLFNQAEQSMEHLINSTSNSYVSNFNNLLNNNSNSLTKINFIDDYQNIANRNDYSYSINNINNNTKLQNFEHFMNPSCSKSINYDNFNNISVSNAAINFNLPTTEICQTQTKKFNESTNNLMNQQTISNNDLNANSLASAIVAAANHFQQKELFNILSGKNNFETNQSIGINKQNFNYNLNDLIYSQEMLKTSINVHQILNQSIENANANDMFKSATTTMAGIEVVGTEQTNYQTATTGLLQTTPNNNTNINSNVNKYFENNNNNKIEIIDEKFSKEITSEATEVLSIGSTSVETSSAFRPINKIDKENELIKLKENKEILSSALKKTQKTTTLKHKQSFDNSKNKINETLKQQQQQQDNETTELTTFNDFVTMALNSIVFATNNQSANTLNENGTTSDSFNNINNENQICKSNFAYLILFI